MGSSNVNYRVRQCSKCLGDNEYYCLSCPCDLCSQSKEKHVKVLKTIDRKVVLHRENFNLISKNEIWMKHPKKLYREYCEFCEQPVCNNCQRHRKHTKKNKFKKGIQCKKTQWYRSNLRYQR